MPLLGSIAYSRRSCVSHPLHLHISMSPMPGCAILVSITLECRFVLCAFVQIDWRPLLPRIAVPCLNLVGRRSAVFPWWGTEIVGRLIPNCHTVRTRTTGTHCSAHRKAGLLRMLLLVASLHSAGRRARFVGDSR